MRFRIFSDVKIFKRECKLLARNIYETVLYRLDRSKRTSEPAKRVVFVCTGNICRSAFAEYLMKVEFKGKFLSIESCGLNVLKSAPSPLEVKMTAEKFGLNLEDHSSKGLECCDMEHADLILAMEYWQYRKLVELLPHKKENIKLLREFAPFPINLLCNINDPFGQSEDVFERCFHQIKECQPCNNVGFRQGQYHK